jgi:transposase
VAGDIPVGADVQATGARIADLEAENTKLSTQVRQLTKQVAELRELLNQNSTNSHLPPSSDGPGAGARAGGPTRKKTKSKRKRGGQKGRRGAHRKLAASELVDTFNDLFPDSCSGCAATLPATFDADALRYQQTDLREHQPHLTEWRRHEVACPRCGTKTRATFDGAQIPSSAFGPCLTAVAVLLTGVYHLSRRQAQRLLRELFDISVSLGALSAMEHRASKALKESYDEALHEVEHADIKHTDATSWLRSGNLTSLWTLATTTATVFAIFTDGCRATIRPFFGACRGILVSDRATVFGFWAMVARQICWAHLLRKFISFSERDGPAGRLGQELLDLTALVFNYWHGLKDGLLTRAEFKDWLQPVRCAFERTIRSAVCAQIPKLSGACADILRHQDALWTFVDCEGVEPTNNHAERELRAFVLWRKRSFGSQSDRGERFAERMMTVAHTARKQGMRVLAFLTRSIEAHLDGAAMPRLIGA